MYHVCMYLSTVNKTMKHKWQCGQVLCRQTNSNWSAFKNSPGQYHDTFWLTKSFENIILSSEKTNICTISFGIHPRICCVFTFSSGKIMIRMKLGSSTLFAFVTCIVLLRSPFLQLVRCQVGGMSPTIPANFDFLTRLAYNGLNNMTSDILSSKLIQDYSFCIADP